MLVILLISRLLSPALLYRVETNESAGCDCSDREKIPASLAMGRENSLSCERREHVSFLEPILASQPRP